MNVPEEDLAYSDPKAKTEIKKGLSTAHNNSEEPKKKQVKLRNDLENPNARLTDLEKKEKELSSRRNDLKNSTSSIMELKEKQKELGALHNDLENANSRIKELEEKVKELETLGKDFENEANLLKEQMADKQKTEDTFPEFSSHGKEAFRIDLYPYEGHYQGKVVHLLTKEKKAFTGIDHKAITDFINEHLPQPEESFDTPELVSPVASKSMVETQIQDYKMARIRKFSIVQEGKFQKEKSISNDQIFQVSLVIDPLESVVEENLPCPYNISVYAKRMGGGFKQIMGKSDGQIIRVGEFTANVHCFPLPAGIYRIMAFGTINIKNDRKESIIQFQESNIVTVV